MPDYISYEQSKERCRNIQCGQCGRALRPLKQGDYEKRFTHITCGDRFNAMVREYELTRQWENYMLQQN